MSLAASSGPSRSAPSQPWKPSVLALDCPSPSTHQPPPDRVTHRPQIWLRKTNQDFSMTTLAEWRSPSHHTPLSRSQHPPEPKWKDSAPNWTSLVTAHQRVSQTRVHWTALFQALLPLSKWLRLTMTVNHQRSENSNGPTSSSPSWSAKEPMARCSGPTTRSVPLVPLARSHPSSQSNSTQGHS